MDSADIYDGSSTRRVRAWEYDPYKYWGCEAYCPYCGEPVIFASGDCYAPYFKHKPGSEIAPTCEKFVSNTSNSDGLSRREISQKVLGLPLYLELIGDMFHLYLGLKAEKLYDLISYTTESLTIQTAYLSKIAEIPISDLAAGTTSFCPLTSVETRKYFETTPTYPSYKKKVFALGLFEEGTLFHIHSKKCPRVGLKADITVGTYYYLLVRKREFHNKPFLDFREREYPICSNGSNDWVVYEVAFTNVSDEAVAYAKHKFRVNLTEKKQPLVALWPPMIQYDDVDDELKKTTTHYLKNSATVFYAIPQRDSNQHTIHSLDVSTNQKIPEKTGTQPTDFDIDESMHILDYTPPSVEVFLNKEPLSLDGKTYLLPKSEKNILKIQSDMKYTLSVTNGRKLKEIHQARLSYRLRDPEAGDTFSFYHGLDCIASFSFKRKGRGKPGSVSDEELYTRLIKKEDVLIPFPMKLKYALSMFENYPKTYLKLTMLLKSGKIGKSTAESLERIVRNGGEL